MTICSFGTPFFNIKSDTFVKNDKFLADKHSHKKNYNRKRDFS